MRRDQEPAEDAQVHSVTSANEAASIESRQRLRAYAIKMGLRVVFVVAGAIIAVNWSKWIGLVLMGISAVLPWFAVMGANLIRPPEQVMGANYAGPAEPHQLSPEPEQDASDPADSSARQGGVTIEGELAVDEEADDPKVDDSGVEDHRARDGEADGSEARDEETP